MTSQTYTQRNTNVSTQAIIRLLVGILICTVFAYVYTLFSTTMLAANKRALESEIQQLHSEISQKEMNYLALSDNLDENTLSLYGFSEAHDVHFISRTQNQANTIALATPSHHTH